MAEITIDTDKLDAYVDYYEDGYFVQVLKEGFFTDKWVDIKGFGDKKRAEELLKILKGE